MKETTLVFRCNMCGREVHGSYRIVWALEMEGPITPSVHLCSHECIGRYAGWLSKGPMKPGELPETYVDSVRARESS